MKRMARLLYSMLALSLAIDIGLRSVQAALAQAGAGRLTIQLTNVTDLAMVDYDNVVMPVIPAIGGTCAVPIICYSGPAIVLGVEDCGTNSLRIESSRDLANWGPFPQPGFQLTLGTNSAAVIPMTGTNRFFRAVWE